MRGRRPSGPELVHRLDLSPAAKKRLQAVLETVAGQLRVYEACMRLRVGEQRFDQLRDVAMQAAGERLESRPAGRRRQRASAADAELRQLRRRVAELEAELRAARARAE